MVMTTLINAKRSSMNKGKANFTLDFVVVFLVLTCQVSLKLCATVSKLCASVIS
jgi:hypothetical protein